MILLLFLTLKIVTSILRALDECAFQSFYILYIFPMKGFNELFFKMFRKIVVCFCFEFKFFHLKFGFLIL